jgi:hypothetical protein
LGPGRQRAIGGGGGVGRGGGVDEEGDKRRRLREGRLTETSTCISSYMHVRFNSKCGLLRVVTGLVNVKYVRPRAVLGMGSIDHIEPCGKAPSYIISQYCVSPARHMYIDVS